MTTAEEVTAKAVAKGKCYSCGLVVAVAKSDVVMDPKHKHMVLHEEPCCNAFLTDEADVFARRCDLKLVDPITEAMRDMIK